MKIKHLTSIVTSIVTLSGLLAISAYAQDTVHGAVRPQDPQGTAPASVEWGDTESNTRILAFYETRECKTVPANFKVNLNPTVDDPGIYSAQAANASSSQIAPGTRVRCIYLHADSIGTPDTNTPEVTGMTLQGGVALDHDIVGIITSSALLVASDDLCQAPLTDYPADPHNRGLESNGPNDAVQFTANGVVNVRMGVTHPGDQVRILKACCDSAYEECSEGESSREGRSSSN